MAKYVAHHAAPPNKPGENWVDKVGGLPKPIDAVMRALMGKGFSQQRAVATAVNHVKKTCATGRAFGGKTPVSAEARATACRAVAEWEAKKARARSLSIPASERLAIQLAMGLADGSVSTVIDMANSRQGLVPVKVKVTNKKGTTFERTMFVRPNQAKALQEGNSPAKLTKAGTDVTKATRGVLEELAKVPRDQRPAGWQDAVKALADVRHGGRLGPEKRRALRDLQKAAPDGSPLKAAVTNALKTDAEPTKKVERRATRKAEKNARGLKPNRPPTPKIHTAGRAKAATAPKTPKVEKKARGLKPSRPPKKRAQRMIGMPGGGPG